MAPGIPVRGSEKLPLQRRLTTILVLDVVDYSRLMEADEPATFQALQAHLSELIRPAIDFRGGRIVKLLGDGLLAEFSSTVDAVQCAVALQRGMVNRSGTEAVDREIVIRIGIHVGDVITENDDLHGDGVNIAARLEGLAEPGKICISQQVLDQIGTHVDVACTDLGPQNLKNISRPVRAYMLDPFARSKPARPATKAKRLQFAAGLVLLAVFAIGATYLNPWSARNAETIVARQASMLPSIVVLPFENRSDEERQSYLADGITDDLTTDLARVSGLVVIARESAFTFKGTKPNLSEVAKQLDVRYVVQGSLRRTENRIRINTQLIDTKSATHIWAERYDGSTQDILTFQDDVRQRIVSALKVKLTPGEAERLSRSITENTDAYDSYLRARQQESYFTRDSVLAAIRLYHEALEKDPDFVTAKARLATAYTLAVDYRWIDDPASKLELARSLAREAISKDSNLPIAHWAMARVYTRKEYFDEDKAIASLERAIQIDPNYADAYAVLSNTLHLAGRSEEGLAHIETAMRLNPRFPFWYYYALGANQFHLTRYEAAKTSFLKTIERNPQWQSSHRYLIATYGHLGLIDDAEWQMEELRSLGFEPTMENFRRLAKYQDASYRERYFQGLRKAGVPEK